MQARRLRILPEQAQAPHSAASMPAEQSSCSHLGPEQASLIHKADTFFIATYHEAELDDPVSVRAGNDISHRGGPPGFVQLNGLDRLTWPDYIGNNFFQSLGEVLCYPCLSCALLSFPTLLHCCHQVSMLILASACVGALCH